MRWMCGGAMHLHSEDGRFYLFKAETQRGTAYVLVDGDTHACIEFGEGAKERCMQLAIELQEKSARIHRHRAGVSHQKNRVVR